MDSEGAVEIGSHLLGSIAPLTFECLEPKRISVVLGQSNNPESEVNIARVLQDSVPIIRRKSGGGTVVLTPGMLVTSIVVGPVPLKNTRCTFQFFTDLFVSFLSGLGVKDVSHKGSSDICIGDRKIMGSSLYRSKDQVLYHNVLLVSPDLDQIETYLKHPSKEPEYREGRSHLSFITSLKESGYTATVTEVKRSVSQSLSQLTLPFLRSLVIGWSSCLLF